MKTEQMIETLRYKANNIKAKIEQFFNEVADKLEEYKEKQTAKKPKEYEDKYYACPVCGNPLMMKWEKYPTELKSKTDGLQYCLHCEQKIDWSEVE